MSDSADALRQGGVGVAEPHHQRVRCEVAQGVACQFLETADEGLAVAVAGGIGVSTVLGTARDGVPQRVKQQVDGREQHRESHQRQDK